LKKRRKESLPRGYVPRSSISSSFPLSLVFNPIFSCAQFTENKNPVLFHKRLFRSPLAEFIARRRCFGVFFVLRHLNIEAALEVSRKFLICRTWAESSFFLNVP
jgi:hypothetical protein